MLCIIRYGKSTVATLVQTRAIRLEPSIIIHEERDKLIGFLSSF